MFGSIAYRIDNGSDHRQICCICKMECHAQESRRGPLTTPASARFVRLVLLLEEVLDLSMAFLQFIQFLPSAPCWLGWAGLQLVDFECACLSGQEE